MVVPTTSLHFWHIKQSVAWISAIDPAVSGNTKETGYEYDPAFRSMMC